MTEPAGVPGGSLTWQRVLERLRSKLTPQQYETWFARLSEPRQDGDRLCLKVPNRFYADWLMRNYEDVLSSTVAEVTGTRPSLLIEVESQEVLGSEKSAEPFEFVTAPKGSPPGVTLNPHHTFDSFVVGPNNRLAHAAAMAVGDSPGDAYNPLFLHGACGLGKTHLLHAVWRRMVERQPDARIVFLSCEGFVSDFVRALETNQVETFRQRYRQADAFIVDDVHFLANKERTQEEFFHTFNSLYARRRQVVLSSDSSPQEIPTLTERLVSRFKWGLVARLDPPSFETRLAIVRQKTEARNLHINDEVASLVAQRVSSNVRELEGAVIRLVGYASLSGRPLDLELANEVLRDSGLRRPGMLLETIQEVVARAYKVRRSELVGKRRTKSLAFPRQVAIYLARKLTGHSLAEIGQAFGGRDHSTVLYAYNKIERERAGNPQLRDMIERLSGELRRPEERKG